MTLSIGKSEGFTLIELLIVTMVIAVLVGVSVPRFRKTFDDLKLNDSAHNLASLMRYARARSIIERLKYRVNFDTVGERYWLTRQKGVDLDYESFKGRFGKTYKLPVGIDLSCARSKVAFYPDGSAEPVAVYLISRIGTTYTLSTKGRGGNVTVFNYRWE